jgi:CheY-like chemotaxis protein
MMPVLLGENIAVTTTIEPGLWRVRTDQAQIEQVIVNLVVNARDAMPRGGTLTIDIRNIILDAKMRAAHPEMTPGSYVVTTIADSGHGMDEDTRSRAFDPFFTTKPVGQGSGLGLSTAYGFIKQSGGFIHLESAPDAGTTIQIYLPRVDATVTIARAPAGRNTPAGDETVLLVEDESAVRVLLASVLGRAGYRLLEAPDGRAALDMAAAHGGPIHLLISDIIMPGINGSELGERLTGVRPDTKVLLISGYADNLVAEQTASMPGTAFLRKPFTPAEFLTRVREVLDDNDHGRRTERP